MVFAAFLFGLVVFSVSAFCLLAYIRSSAAMRQSHRSWARQHELQLRLQAELQTRIEADARRFEERRRALVERAGEDNTRANVEHAA